MKSKFIYVSPISADARIFFEMDMNLLHSCKVKSEDTDQYHVESITKQQFSVNKHNDFNWRIEQ
jgi:hypothetical protein|tara:strand:+ start:1638 stop:1829 length:192 start_codon:yes stop_codon:yes gene_type:complete